MSKSRKAVPAALHTEISEYVSLLRALRTSGTLDLSSQLTKAHQSAPKEAEDDAEGRVSLNRSDSRDITPSHTPLSKSSAGHSTGKSSVKDNWTRWPLLEGDVHVPEFGLHDEIKMIASEALKLQFQPDSDVNNLSEDDNDEEKRLPQSFLDSLTLASSTHLSRLLSALAAHIPLTEKSMQNRILPIGWESVLDIVAVSGLVDPKAIEDVQRRMETLYNSSDRHSVSRAHLNTSAKRTLDDFVAMHDMSFLAFHGPAVQVVPQNRRKRRKKRNAEDCVDESRDRVRQDDGLCTE